MAYTLEDWTEFCQNEVDLFTVISLPVSAEALDTAIPGSKAHCTIANALVAYTGMDPKAHAVSVEGMDIKFVLNGKRYFFAHEVAGVEHIKALDTLAFCEGGDDSARQEFEPFVLKLRYREDRPVHSRPRAQQAAQTPAEKKKKAKKAKAMAQVIAFDEARGKRKDAGIVKSRWARKTA